MSGLAAYQDAAHRTRVANSGSEPAACLLRRGQIGKVGTMTLARMDDAQSCGARRVEHPPDRRDCAAQQEDIIAKRRAEPAGLEKIALHVDYDQARARRIEIERVGSASMIAMMTNASQTATPDTG